MRPARIERSSKLRSRRRPADRGAWRADRRHGRRQPAGGFFERRRRAELRRRDAAGLARHQRPHPARAPSRIADRRQSRRRDRRRRRHLRRWRQHRRPAPGAGPAWHRLHLADRLRSGQKQARSRLPPAWQPSRQEYRRAGSRLRCGHVAARWKAALDERAGDFRDRHCGRKCAGRRRPGRVGALRGRRPRAVRARRRAQDSRSREPRGTGTSCGTSFGSSGALQEPVG